MSRNTGQPLYQSLETPKNTPRSPNYHMDSKSIGHLSSDYSSVYSVNEFQLNIDDENYKGKSKFATIKPFNTTTEDINDKS
jgi:hypothetical protein